MQVGIEPRSSSAVCFSDMAKYNVENGNHGLVVLRHKKDIEIVHAADVKVKLSKSKKGK